MFKNISPWRLAVVLFAGFMVLIIVLWMLGFAVRAGMGIIGYSPETGDRVLSLMSREVGGGYGGATKQYFGNSAAPVPGIAYDRAESSVSMPVPVPGYVPGNDAEEYETTDYYATIRTVASAPVCDEIEWLKDSPEVIFEHADRSENSCSYQFKVTASQAPAVVALIEGFDPEELTARTYTAKRELEAYTDELEILNEKLAAIDETLAAAESAYAEITELAGSSGNPESLAKVIEGRIQIIDRLTRDRLMVAQEIARYQKAHMDALDRLNYSHFTVSVYGYRIFDWENLKNQWIESFQQFVHEANMVLQGITVGLLAFLLRLAQFALYLVIIVVVIKFGWRFVMRVWDW